MSRGVRLAVLGDLHYEPVEQERFNKARNQILSYQPDAIAQLGDLGGYTHPGTQTSFDEGRAFLSSFQLPFYTLMGNHDLDDTQKYKTDQAVIDTWCKTFDYNNPYYAVDLEHTLLLFLSSTMARDNEIDNQVRLDEAQINWFKEVVKANTHRPIFVFSHAPILGSNLKVLQNLHLKVPNAWINHSHKPEQFIEIVNANPQIKLWVFWS